MPRQHGRIDANQHDIVEAFRDVGATVRSIADVGQGIPDLLVGFRGVNYLFECKMPFEALTPAEKTFFETWQGDARVIRSPDEGLRAIGAI